MAPRPLLAVPLLALVACADRPGEGPRSALLITLDTTRADALGSYGGRPGLTPFLDALAEESLVFDQAYTVTPLTLPSHASMLTGLIPPRHGLRQNGASRLTGAAETLAERARAEDLTTAAFLASVVLDPAFGLEQGFERYDSPRHGLQQATTHYASRGGPEMVERARAWLRGRAEDERFFLWIHLWDPHGPFEPSPEFARRAPDSPYLGEVAAVDDAVGRLLESLDELGRARDTTVLVVADHGEAFWEHGEYSHGSYCWNTTLRVPLLVRQPGHPRMGERTDEVASVADVTPTLAAALDLGPRPGLDGHDLLGELPADRGAYFETWYGYLAYGWSPLVGWVDGSGKYQHSTRPLLHDPKSDPEERTDLLSSRPGEAARYVAALERALSGAPLPPDEGGAPGAPGLAALGYVELAPTPALPSPLEVRELPSPHDRVDEQKKTLEAQGHFNAGRYAEAERLHREILATSPRHPHSLARLGINLIRQRRHTEAIAPLERACASGRAGAGAWVNLGTCMRVVGNLGRAIECFEEALAVDGSQVRAVRHLVDLYAEAGDAERLDAMRTRYRELTGESLGGGR